MTDTTTTTTPTTPLRPTGPATLPPSTTIRHGGFFDAARRGELVVRRCNGCDAVLHCLAVLPPLQDLDGGGRR